MHNCDSLDPLVTPFVDGELPDRDRRAVEEHLRVCPPCHSRVTAERAVHDLLRARRSTLCRTEAPDALHLRCAELVQASRDEQANAETAETRTSQRLQNFQNRELANPNWRQNENQNLQNLQNPNLGTPNLRTRTPNPELRTPYAPWSAFALAASLVAVVGGAFYVATDNTRVMAAQLVADHEKCFAMNSALGTHQSASIVEQSMGAAFDWPVHLPDEPVRAGLELVGARLCMYGQGKIAHIMYRHQGKPVSVFMLPKTMRAQEFVEVLGKEAAIWCANNRTFVVVAGEPRRNVEQIASFMQASLH